MREELAEKLLCAILNERDEDAIKQKITIILNDYEITERETAIAIRNEDRNRYLLNKFIIAKTVSGRTDRTIKFYKESIVKILERINKNIDEITADDIRYYLALRERVDKVSQVTAQNEFRALSSMYEYLQAEEIILKNPCKKIERPRMKKKQKKAFTEIEIEKIRAACKTNREKAIIETLLSTGCRVTELVMMKREDLTGESIVVHGKGGKDRIVYLNAKAIVMLQAYLNERTDANPYIFCGGRKLMDKDANYQNVPKSRQREWYKEECNVSDTHADKGTIEQMVRKLGKIAGIEKVHPHRFRRTCATLALRRGMPIEQVSKMLGHESIETTQIYLDLSEEDLKTAHKKYVV